MQGKVIYTASNNQKIQVSSVSSLFAGTLTLTIAETIVASSTTTADYQFLRTDREYTLTAGPTVVISGNAVMYMDVFTTGTGTMATS